MQRDATTETSCKIDIVGTQDQPKYAGSPSYMKFSAKFALDDKMLLIYLTSLNHKMQTNLQRVSVPS